TQTSGTTIYVSTRAQLLSALDSAKGGETIVLANGDYGSLNIDNKAYSSQVTITSATPLGATFDNIGVSNSSNISIDAVHVDNSNNGAASTPLVSIDSGSHDVEFVNSEVNGKVDGTYTGFYGIYANDTSNVTFANNYVHDVKNGGVFYNSTSLVISGNTVDYIGEDSFKFISVHGVLIENNTGARFVYPSSTAHCDFVQFQGGDSSDIVIRGNVSLPGNSGGATAQGIFMDDAHYTNVLIENNIIVTGMMRGISVSSGTNVVARYNTVLDVEGIGSKATKVMVAGSSYGNIMGTYPEDKELGAGNNLVIQQSDAGGAWYYGDFFTNADKGLGITLEDLRPIANSQVSDYGAYDRLIELLDGGGSTTPGTAPDTTTSTDTTTTTPTDTSTSTNTGTTAPTDTSTSTSTGTTAPTDTSTSTSTGTVDGAVYSLTGTHDISSAADVIEIAPSADLKLASGTIAFSFTADTVAGTHGLVSKDASYYVGGGNHFAAYIEDGVLKVRFQDGSSDQIFEVPGIKAGVEYDVQFDFDGSTVNVVLDGVNVGTADFGMTWETNTEYLQFGALGWGSKTGEAG
ncbi:right-handed parallel beta-helix repeat-containing protein, partial [Primorskyibacter sp. 2E233]|uniref:right-handed parallel beta-helix repeat-containing protein n=1 Tax=Primorskyibacter sp. 2E233 TaxID=3413431 RepID=UPI003BF02034